jgi:hypothetical protein
VTGPVTVLPWGSDDERGDYYEPDPHRHCLPEEPCRHLADADWSRTLAALDGDGGVSIYARAELDDEAMWGDWEAYDEPEGH